MKITDKQIMDAFNLKEGDIIKCQLISQNTEGQHYQIQEDRIFKGEEKYVLAAKDKVTCRLPLSILINYEFDIISEEEFKRRRRYGDLTLQEVNEILSKDEASPLWAISYFIELIPTLQALPKSTMSDYAIIFYETYLNIPNKPINYNNLKENPTYHHIKSVLEQTYEG
jgi:hypothetical protein